LKKNKIGGKSEKNNFNMIPMINNIIFKIIILNNKKVIYEESEFMV
jgi:hypothetical protein